MWATVDRALRLAYCLLLPVLLYVAMAVLPVTGMVIGAAIATAMVIGEGTRWRAGLERVPVVGRIVRGAGQLGAYYAARPPRPLPYYLVYPLLAPYWLFVREARREFLLYRKANVVALVVLLAAGALEYLRHWRPDLGLGLFIGVMIGTVILQLAVASVVIMPLVTTIVIFHRTPRRGWTRALAGCLALSTAFTVIQVVRKPPLLSAMVGGRLWLRAAAVPRRAKAAEVAAVAAVRAALPADQPEGFVDGEPLAAARAALGEVFIGGEAAAFGVWVSAPPRTVMVFAVDGQRAPLWLATGPGGAELAEAALPAPARQALTRKRLPR